MTDLPSPPPLAGVPDSVPADPAPPRRQASGDVPGGAPGDAAPATHHPPHPDEDPEGAAGGTEEVLQELPAPPPLPPDPPRPEAFQAVGVRLAGSCMVFRVRERVEGLVAGDQVWVNLREGGEAMGHVVYATTVAEEEPRPGELLPGPIARLVRRVTNGDRLQQERLAEREAKARLICREQIRKLNLDMRLSRITFDRDGSRAVFYFTAEQRVDFRELVRILARRLRVRVEMRQIGVRDEARLLGGLGPCGQELCCAQHMRSFHPVSVRMAKNQEMSLNPEAISGVCGRLMCCLAYENQVYVDLRAQMPKPNTRMVTREGQEVVVKGGHPMKNTILAQLADGSKQVIPLVELTPVAHPFVGPLPATPPGGAPVVPSSRGGPGRGRRPPGADLPPAGGETRREERGDGRGRGGPPPPTGSGGRGAPAGSRSGVPGEGGRSPQGAKSPPSSPRVPTAPAKGGEGAAPPRSPLPAVPSPPAEGPDAAAATPPAGTEGRRRRRSRRRRSRRGAGPPPAGGREGGGGGGGGSGGPG